MRPATSTRASFQRPSRAALLLGAVLLLAATAASAVRDPAKADATPFTLVGEVALHPNDAVVVDNTRKQLIAFDGVSRSSTPGIVIDAFAGPRLALRKSVTLPTYFPPYGIGILRNAHAFDEAGGRLFLVVYPSYADQTAHTNPRMVVLDADLNVVSDRPLNAFPQGASLYGMSYFPPTNALYALGAANPDPASLTGNYAVALQELDADTGAPRWTAPYPIAGCQKPVSYRYQAAVVRNAELGKVFFGCGTGNLLLSPEPGSPFVASVDVRDPANLSLKSYPIAGSYAQGDTIADEVNGRFLMLATTPRAPVQAVWIFDEKTEVFTGVVNAGQINVWGAGIDKIGGRLYVAIDDAILVGSHVGLRVPQADRYAEPGVMEAASGIVPVRFNRQLIVPVTRPAPDGFSQEYHWLLYDNAVPDYRPPPPDDPDARTEDIPEIPGKTSADFNGDGQAFGSRLAEVGGMNGVVQNVVPTDQNYWDFFNGYVRSVDECTASDDAEERENGQPDDEGSEDDPKCVQDFIPKAHDGDRRVTFASVEAAHLSQSEATAKTISAVPDPMTAEDYRTANARAAHPDGNEAPVKEGEEDPYAWPYKVAECADFGDGEQVGRAEDATATCDRKKSVVEASTVYDQTASFGVFRVGASSTNVKVARTAELGTKVVSRAEADNVTLAPGASIGKIISESTARAHGRRGTAQADYKRIFQNVSLPGYSCDTDCDPEEVVRRINNIPGLTFRAELPSHELQATPKGAHAHALRDPWGHQQEVILQSVPDTDLQVPALRLIYYNDNFSVSRFVLDVAGTSAAANYNISSVADGSGPDAPPPGPGDDATAGVESGLTLSPGPQSIGPTEPVKHTEGGNALTRLLRRLGHGLKLLLTGRLATPLAICIFTLFGTPVFLAGRRRLLINLMRNS